MSALATVFSRRAVRQLRACGALLTAALLLTAMLVAGCGASRPSSVATLAPRLASGEARQAREFAPDLVASAELALGRARAAEAAGDAETAADEATAGRAWLDAAVAEAARATIERRRIAIENEIVALELDARRDEEVAAALRENVTRLAALRVARERAARAYALAVADEGRRGRGLPRDAAEAQAVRRVLLERAHTHLAIASALGAPQGRCEAVRALVDRAEGTRPSGRATPTAREAALAPLLQALAATEALVGEARARSTLGDELARFVDAIAFRGFEVAPAPSADGTSAVLVRAPSSRERVPRGNALRAEVSRVAASFRGVRCELRADASLVCSAPPAPAPDHGTVQTSQGDAPAADPSPATASDPNR